MSSSAAAQTFSYRAGRRSFLQPAGHWLGHLTEMVLAMLIGMEILFGEFAAVANALGYANVMVQLPEISTVVMTLTMAVPMALWMDYRGHPRHGVAEMSAVMVLPTVVVLLAGAVGLIAGIDLPSASHLWMYVAMVGLMVYRWPQYSRGSHG